MLRRYALIGQSTRMFSRQYRASISFRAACRPNPMLELMARFAITTELAIMLCVGGYLSACSSSRPVQNNSTSSCGNGPISTLQGAERHATCYFRAISEACYSPTGSFHFETVRKGDVWEVRSVAPTSSCKSWIVVFSAADGHVSMFESEQ